MAAGVAFLLQPWSRAAGNSDWKYGSAGKKNGSNSSGAWSQVFGDDEEPESPLARAFRMFVNAALIRAGRKPRPMLASKSAIAVHAATATR